MAKYIFNEDFNAKQFVFSPQTMTTQQVKTFKKGEAVEVGIKNDFGLNKHLVTKDGFDVTSAKMSLMPASGEINTGGKGYFPSTPNPNSTSDSEGLKSTEEENEKYKEYAVIVICGIVVVAIISLFVLGSKITK